MPQSAVSLGPPGTPPDSRAIGLAEQAAAAASGSSLLDGAVALAVGTGASLPRPGGGTRVLWECLASAAAVDLTLARVLEPHHDALSILAESGADPVAAGSGLWGVYAAEGGGGRLEARETEDGWFLEGPKPWCSLADRADRALVTAWVDDARRGLFAIDLADPGVRRDEGEPWVSRGLREVRSTGLVLEGVPATPVGPPGWYLERPGFAWGGAGVAAIWYGGAVALARRLLAASRQREPDQVALLHLGAVDAALQRARAVLAEAAAQADAHAASVLPAMRARQVVADTVEEVISRVARALGPGPLTGDEEHARRVADLGVYVRQHHAERDLAALGSAVLGAEASPW